VAWSTPLTAVSGTVLTAAQWNASVRDNLLETSAAAVTTAGDMTRADGANSMTRFAIGGTGDYLRVASGVPAWVNSHPLIGVGNSDSGSFSTSGTLKTSFPIPIPASWSTGWSVRISGSIRLIFNGTATTAFYAAYIAGVQSLGSPHNLTTASTQIPVPVTGGATGRTDTGDVNFGLYVEGNGTGDYADAKLEATAVRD